MITCLDQHCGIPNLSNILLSAVLFYAVVDMGKNNFRVLDFRFLGMVDDVDQLLQVGSSI